MVNNLYKYFGSCDKQIPLLIRAIPSHFALNLWKNKDIFLLCYFVILPNHLSKGKIR